MNARLLLIEARRHLEAAVRGRPDHPRYLELLGEACLVGGDSLAAIPPLERARAGHPSARATWLLAWAYVHAGRLADVERLVRELFESGHGCARALYVRGLARFQRRATDLALADLRQAMPDEADVPFFRRELVRALIGAALAPGAGSGPSAARTALLREAVALLKSGDHDDAANADERKYLLGCALLELGETTRALSVLAETDFPSRAEASLRRGLAAAREGDAATALACFADAGQAPALARAAEACAGAVGAPGGVDAAPVPRPAIAPLGLGPLSAPALACLVIQPEGPWPAAAPPPPAADEPAGGPGAAPALGAEGAAAIVDGLRASLRRKQPDFGAMSDCVALLESGALDAAARRRVHETLAVALHLDLKSPPGDVERKVPLLARVCRAAPGVAYPHWYLARYRFLVQDYAGAREEVFAIDGALRRRPMVLNLLGRAFEKLHRFEYAERAWRQSLAQEPAQPTIQVSLGRLLLQRYRRLLEATS